jgi:hypothetical protein
MWTPSEYPLALQLVLAVLATYRLASLITREEGPYVALGAFKDDSGLQAGVFERIRQWAGVYGDQKTSVSRGIVCPLCVGLYAAAVVLALISVPYVNWLVLWLGIAGGQTFLYRLHGGD